MGEWAPSLPLPIQPYPLPSPPLPELICPRLFGNDPLVSKLGNVGVRSFRLFVMHAIMRMTVSYPYAFLYCVAHAD